MATEMFKASVQYNDMKGTAAADRADTTNASAWLKQKGLITDDELLLGIELMVGENHGNHRDPVHVAFSIASLDGNFDNVAQQIKNAQGTTKVRRVTQDMTIAEFLGLFKRFNVTLSSDSLLEGRELEFDDE